MAEEVEAAVVMRAMASGTAEVIIGHNTLTRNHRIFSTLSRCRNNPSLRHSTTSSKNSFSHRAAAAATAFSTTATVAALLGVEESDLRKMRSNRACCSPMCRFDICVSQCCIPGPLYRGARGRTSTSASSASPCFIRTPWVNRYVGCGGHLY